MGMTTRQAESGWRDCLLFGVEDAEDAMDVGEVERVAYRRVHSEEDELLLPALRVSEHLNQGGDAGTIDVPQRSQVEGQLLRIP
jgi:hypothetical protein